MSPMVKLPLSLEHALLGFLRDGPSYPYEVHQRLESTEVLHLVWHIKQRQTYALLERLEAEGYLDSSTVAQGNRPPRRMLQLTAQGREVFESWLTTPVAHGRDFRQEFMAKLYFAQHESGSQGALLIERQQVACQNWLQDLRVRESTLSSERPLDRLVVQFRIGQVEAALAWLDVCSTRLGVAVTPEGRAP